ncbi:MAG: glycosyltransferase family 2 protein [Myxococcales bacterium]|nr:glycosyltransferase family 2 protein [Myxococcales bacterium]
MPLSDLLCGNIFVVIPAYNEGESSGEVIQNLPRWCTCVVVDDGSMDDTAEQAARAGATVLRHVVNRGQGAALQTGIDYALSQGAKIIVTYDADGQHDPADLERLIAPLREGRADVALGSRFLEHVNEVPRTRRMVLRAAVLFTRMTSGLKLTDTHNGYRALSRAAAQKVSIRLDRMAHASEILDQIRIHKLRYVEVPVRIRYTEYSRQKGQRARAAFRIAIDYLLGKLVK